MELDNIKKSSFDRKPKPGMFYRARDEFEIDLSKSLLIGDKESDIEAGISAGLFKMFLFFQNLQSNLIKKILMFI